ncbi:MAG TPA: DUF3105 domain-containing protein [Acidimicrobiales bacterium]|nr:DUF3105 domain-containing protein [Acidimicrobiales bacterium]
MRRLAVLVVLVAGLAACGGDEGADCGPVSREALDPSSGLHVLPGEDVPEYATDPPTSGAHYSLPPPTGAVDEPVDRPLQVTALEGGMVLVQHNGLSDDEVAELEELGSDQVIVAPNEDQSEPVVLTAWLTKQTCSGVDVGTVEDFVEEQQGRGPGTDF